MEKKDLKEIYASLIEDSNFLEAKKIILNLPPAVQQKPENIMRLADCLYELEDYGGAILKYSKVIDFPQPLKFKPNAYFNRGLCWREQDEFNKALLDFKNAADGCDKASFYIGEMYYLTSEYEMSYNVLKIWTKENDKDCDGLRTLALVSNQLDKHNEALSLFKMIFELGEKDREILDGIITELNWMDEVAELKDFASKNLNDTTDPDGELREKAADIIQDFESVQS